MWTTYTPYTHTPQEVYTVVVVVVVVLPSKKAGSITQHLFQSRHAIDNVISIRLLGTRMHAWMHHA